MVPTKGLLMAVIKLRRGPSDGRLKFIPDDGEIVLDMDEMQLYVGDGKTPGGILIKNGHQMAKKALNDQIRYSFNQGKFFVVDKEDI